MKILNLIIVIVLFFNNYSFSKMPPPGTGTANVPANILIMLDNSGSMAWDLNGYERYAGSGKVQYPIDIKRDSNGDLYVLTAQRKIIVLGSDGTFKRELMGYANTRNCMKINYAYKFDLYDDKLYVYDAYDGMIKIINKNNNSCQGVINSVGQWRDYNWGIEVTSNYIFAGYSGFIDIYNRNTLSKITRSTPYMLEGRTTMYNGLRDITVNSAGTKMLVSLQEVVCEHNLNGYVISNKTFSSCKQIGIQRSEYEFRGSVFKNDRGGINRPVAAEYDSSGNIYVAQAVPTYMVQKFNSSGNYITKYGSQNNPWLFFYGMEVGSNNKIYIGDYTSSGTIYELSTNISLLSSFKVEVPSRLDIAKKVIKKIVSNSELTRGANFGLMEWGHPTRVIRSYSMMNNPYQGWRYNYYGTRMLVRITSDGARQIYNVIDNVKAGGGTYLDYAMNLALAEYTGSNSPIIKGADCQKNYLIVISDGDWANANNVNNLAKAMAGRDPSIKTFVVGFAVGGNKPNYTNLATAGGTVTPLYAENEDQLLEKLTDAIKQITASTLTFTTPAVMAEVNKGDYVYQSTFEYDPYKQWKGHLKKIPILDNGTLGTAIWDAADKLNIKASSTRKIWTVGTSISGLNNFTTSNRSDLKSLLFTDPNISDSEVDKLINFIRGDDSYDEDKDGNTTESRHKLADIYHSNPIIVGPPDSSISYDNTYQEAYYRSINNYSSFQNGNSCGINCNIRKEIVLAGSNGGMLHAFDTSNGEELWSFIPPSVIGKLKNVISSKLNSSNAIYAVDGSPIVKDIFYDNTPNDGVNNPQWRTIILTGLGEGGYSYFALDITNPTNPSHLFTIENDPFNKVINFWDANGVVNKYSYNLGIIDADRDYRRLGEATSTPRIIKIKVNNSNNQLIDKWVAVFGAGYNGATNPEYGSAVFVMDLENEGKLLKTININDQIPRSSRSIEWSSPNNNTQTTWNLASLGLSSYDSSIYTLKLSGSAGIDYSYNYNENGTIRSNINIVFDSPPPSNNIFRIDVVDKNDIVNSVPTDLLVITADSTSKANYNGAMVYAADLEGKITKINLTDKGNLYESTLLFDADSTTSNGRYIYQNIEATINKDNYLWLYFGTGDTHKIQDNTLEIKNRLYGIKDKDFPEFKLISQVGTISKCKTVGLGCPTIEDLGWYVELEKARKLTGMPTVQGDVVYFPLYEPNNSNICSYGDAWLYALNSECGNSLYSKKIGTGVLTKVVTNKSKIIIGISGKLTEGTDFNSQGNLLIGNAVGKAPVQEGIQVETWRQN